MTVPSMADTTPVVRPESEYNQEDRYFMREAFKE
ncbi:hypothetical protein KIPB_007142, partial [Kipferlia bialata]|eukprot:g7142.t1